jgi:IMP dehydrogenase
MIHGQPGLTYYDVLLKPRKATVNSRTEISLKTRLTKRLSIDVPLVSAAMDSITESEFAIALAEVGGIGMIHRFCTIEKQAEEVRKVKQRGLKVGAAIGVTKGELERTAALIEAGCDVFLLDVAHAHAESTFAFLEELYRNFPNIDLIVGAIATDDAVKEFIERFPQIGGFKIGIGGGSACTTREKTGCGVPLVTCIQLCKAVSKDYPLMADGSIRSSGSVVKALAFGADTVQFGGMFAGCRETPTINGKKVYRGMASRDAILDNNKAKTYVFEEGVSQVVTEKEISVKDIVHEQLIPGTLSGLSYLGVKSIAELHKIDIQYYTVSANGQQETNTHKWN